MPAPCHSLSSGTAIDPTALRNIRQASQATPSRFRIFVVPGVSGERPSCRRQGGRQLGDRPLPVQRQHLASDGAAFRREIRRRRSRSKHHAGAERTRPYRCDRGPPPRAHRHLRRFRPDGSAAALTAPSPAPIVRATPGPRAEAKCAPRTEEPVAQPVEHLTFNQGVPGSNPGGLTIWKYGGDEYSRRFS
jgi:hypothetical protein